MSMEDACVILATICLDLVIESGQTDDRHRAIGFTLLDWSVRW